MVIVYIMMLQNTPCFLSFCSCYGSLGIFIIVSFSTLQQETFIGLYSIQKYALHLFLCKRKKIYCCKSVFIVYISSFRTKSLLDIFSYSVFRSELKGTTGAAILVVLFVCVTRLSVHYPRSLFL